jgi:filamentous hemagglutinin family protein
MKTIQLFAPLQRALRPASRPRRLVWALALAGVATHTLAPWAGQAHAAGALPTGLNVVQGQATLKQSGNQLTINNSAGAVLNWQSFNIGAANAVRFEQPSAASKVLNRVVGNNPSQIFGKLSSNGEVWLVNPYGVLFGRDSRVDVGSLVVSTLNIGNDDWRAGRFSLTGGAGSAGTIVNQGELLTTTGGRVLLLAGSGGVRNEGLITAPDGQVALAAGASVDLVDGQTRHLAVRVQAPQGEVMNLGSLSVSGTGGGRVDLMAAMVNQQGFVRAESLSGTGGQIVLEGSQGVNLAAGSVTSAAGSQGGQVQVDAVGGTTMLAGEVNVTGHAGKGGDALLLGRQVGLLDGGLVDASGTTAGGRVRVGGGLQGKDDSVVNARAVYMGPGMQIRADATRQGTGGTIILWSDEATRAYGTLSARGGAQGGDGGFIETSGGWLDAQPTLVRTDATYGRAGQWLLDPNNIRIDNQFPNTNVSAGPNFTSTGDSAIVNVASIVAALNGGNNVTITTGTGGANSQAGDITMSNVFLSANPAQPVSLTITAARNIEFFDSTIQTTNAAMGVTLSAANGSSGVGAITLSGVDILTRGGNINLGGGRQAVGQNITSPRAGAVGFPDNEAPAIGVNVEGSTLDAGTGNVTITGQALDNGGRGAAGVVVTERTFFNGEFVDTRPSIIRGRDIDIYGWVDSNAAEARIGFLTAGDVTIRATHGLKITGVANSTVFHEDGGEDQLQPLGVYIAGGTLSVQPAAVDNTAYLTIDGTVRDGAPTSLQPLRVGVWVDGGDSRLEASNGANVTITGRDLMNATEGSVAVHLANNANFDFGTAGSALIEGDTRVLLENVAILAPFDGLLTIGAGDGLRLDSASISGDPSAVSLSARDILLNRSGISIGNSVEGTLSLTASRDIHLLASDIGQDGAPITINLTAAAGGSGSGTVLVEDTYMYSGGGDITIGGGSTAVGPNITAPRTGAVATTGGSSASGVTILNSQVDAGSGALRISGQSVATDGDAYGVHILGLGEGTSYLFGDIIDIFGWVDSNAAVKRTGVYLQAFSYIYGYSSVNITGLANSTVFRSGDVAPIGVEIQGYLNAWNVFQGGGGSFALRGAQPQGGVPQEQPPALTILGTTNDGVRTDDSPTRYGVLIGESAEVIVGFGFDRGRGRGVVINEAPPAGGPSSSITGVDLSANNEVAVRMVSPSANFDFSSSLSIQGNRRVELGGFITAPFDGPMEARAGTTLSLLSDMQVGGAPTTATFQADGLLLASGSINFEAPTSILLRAPEVRLGAGDPVDVVTMGSILVLTDHLVVGQSSRLYAEAEGTAITIAGYDGASNISSLRYDPEASLSLEAEIGRWLIYAVDDSIPDGGLSFSFRQYGMTYPAAPLAQGNGLVYALAPVLTLSSPTAITKPYDGNNTVTTPGVTYSLTGVRPGQGAGFDPSGISVAYPGTAAGANQLLVVSGYVQPDITDANERPVYGYTTQFDVRGDITRRLITLAGVTAANKVYDGSRAADLAGGALANLVAGETLTIALGNGQFDTANVGNGKAVTGTVTLGDGTGLLSNYQLVGGNAVSTTANITPREVSLLSLQANGRVYDGTRNVTVTGGTLTGMVEGETLGLSFANSLFATAGVGNNKLVNTTATLQNGTGLASNYTLLPQQGAYASNAAVTPAALLYVANAATFVAGEVIAGLTGSVTGFVAGETQAGATTGNLVFTANVPAGAGAGTYAITGSGLAAANYTFTQAAANATALTLTPAPITFVPEPVGLPEIDDTQRAFRQALPPLPRGPEGTRTLDALQSLRVDPSWLSMSFGELDLSALSREEIAALLEARRQYKMQVLGVGRDRLAQDPSLADVPACQTARQAADGRCLVTAELLTAIDERGEGAVIATAALPPLPPAVPPIQTLPPVPPITTAPAAPVVAIIAPPQPVAPAPSAPNPAPAAPAATTAAAPAPAAPVEARVPPRVRVAAQPTTVAPALPAARPVRSASIPQIQRKIAVLVGIDNYVDERIPALENARRDADAVARILEDRLGYETIVVRDAGREAMVGVLNKLALQTRPTDSVVVYYAGHGTVIDGTGQGYWIPATADAEKPETWLSNRDIARLLGGIRASQVVLISDSCFSGSLVGDKRLQSSTATDAQAILRRRSTLVMSSGGDEPVADGARNGHSPFANSLMGNLQGLDNWRAGGNVFERVLTEVTQRLPQTPRYGPARDSRYVEGGDYLFEQRQLGTR